VCSHKGIEGAGRMIVTSVADRGTTYTGYVLAIGKAPLVIVSAAQGFIMCG